MEKTINLLDYFKGDELAASVWRSKYALPSESSPDAMHKRLAKEFYNADKKYRNTLDKQELSEYGKIREDLTEESIYDLFKNFGYLIPQGSVMSQLGASSIGSLSNCFVIGQPSDSYGGIFQKDEQMAQLMKRRGGVGIDISTLRPNGTRTSNAAKTSTGAISFMERYSNTTREVAQEGRRGALMISIDVRHPDVMDFATIKKDLKKVTGANISIQMRDDFMHCVDTNQDYLLRFPCSMPLERAEEIMLGGHNIVWNEDLEYDKLYTFKTAEETLYVKVIDARALWDLIIQTARDTAEPGLMFLNNHWEYSPDGVYPQYRGVTTNPCGEIFMQTYDACRLIAINFFSLISNPFTPQAKLNIDKLYKVAYEGMVLSDDLVDLEIKQIDAILDKIDEDPEDDEIKSREKQLWLNILKVASNSRRTGLGETGLGDALAALGFKYDSPEALTVVEEIQKVKLEAELDATIDMAITRGTFKGHDSEKEFEWCISNNDNGEAYLIGRNEFYQMLVDEFPVQAELMRLHGRRNVSWSTVAPGGSISLLAQVTSGLEPLFQPYYIRRKKINPSDESSRIDFTDQNGDNWQEYPVLHPKFQEWCKAKNPGNTREFLETLKKEDLDVIFTESPWYKSTANNIDWIKRVEIQEIIQRYTTHSISSTINLPEEVKAEEVSEIYLESWRRKLKGVTVYREGSRSGVLVTKKDSEFKPSNSPKRPKSLPCGIYHTVVKGQSWAIIVGEFGGFPFEVFGIPDIELGIARKYKIGEIIKESSRKYALLAGEEKINLSEAMSHDQEAITRLVSLSLRHGADSKYVVEQLDKSKGTIVDLFKAISRILKKYYLSETDQKRLTMKSCPYEGKDCNIIMEEGCMKCLECGESKC